MSNDLRQLPEEAVPPASTHMVHALMRFYCVVRRKKVVVFASLGVVGLLGTLFYSTATRVYQSKASLLVLNTGADVMSASMSADRSMQDQMATYERLCTSAVVLEGAIGRLSKIPPEVREKPRNQWVDALRELVSASTVRRTSIIEITCHSRDAAACVNVLDVLVASYLDFIDRNHKNVAAEIVAVLETERVELEDRIQQQQTKLLEAKHLGGDLGIQDNTRYVHPLVHRVMQLNQSLLEVQQRRVHLDASLGAIHRTVQSGGDLRQHLLGLQPLVGKEIILSALGLNGQDSALAADTERQLLEDEAALNTLLEHYGPRHSRVVALQQKIHSGRQYIASFQRQLGDRLAGVSHPELGRMLVTMVQQDLAQTQASEHRLRHEFEQAEANAIALNDRLANVTIIQRDLELLRNMHAALVNRIENTDINQNQADVRVSVISDPVQPIVPVYPRLPQVVLLCLVVGLGLGVSLVYVTDVLDDHFRSPEELQEQLRLPILAMVRKHEARDEVGAASLQLHVTPNAAESEAFRTLRTTLAFSQESVGRIAVTSPEPGDGKTTVLANLGVAYAQVGKRTLLIDGDLRRPGLTSRFDQRGQRGLSDILRSDENVGQMGIETIQPSGIDKLDILPCGPRPSDPAELLGHERFSDLLAWAETIYDQILVDSPPILAASDVAITGRLVDGVVVVVQPHKNHRRHVLRAVESLASLGVQMVGVVVNAVAGETRSGYYGYGGEYSYGYGYGAGDSDVDGDVDEPTTNEAPPSSTAAYGAVNSREALHSFEMDKPTREESVVPVRRSAA